MCQWLKDVVEVIEQHTPVVNAAIEPPEPVGGDEDYDDDLTEEDWEDDYDPTEDALTDVEADSMALAGIGWGTDEDYGFYGANDGDF
jgi:hypothetical protein